MTSVAVLCPGQMGASFGALFRSQLPGVQLLTALSGRSERTRSLAQSAGFHDRSLPAILQEADLILSVTVPSEASTIVKSLVKAAETLSPSEIKTSMFVDLNAISPMTAMTIQDVLKKGLPKVDFLDGGIIGGPASKDYVPLIVLSGQASDSQVDLLTTLFRSRTKMVGTEAGSASALKMSYASLAKGSIGLVLNTSVMASKYGVLEHLEEELSASQPALAKIMTQHAPKSVAKAFRWAGEMEEISATLSSAGMKDSGGKIFLGMAETYKEVADTEVGKEKIEESLEKNRDWKEVVEILAKAKKEEPLAQ